MGFKPKVEVKSTPILICITFDYAGPSLKSLEEDLKKIYRDYALLLGIAGLVIALDQLTKALIRENLPFNEIWQPQWLNWLQPYARIVHINNTGAAFGMGQGYNILFAVLAVLVGIGIIYYFPKVSREDWTLRIAMGLQLGGAWGNLIDRLREGRVTDFISLGNFAVFNVADSSITIGVIILLMGVLIKEKRDKKVRDLAASMAAQTSVLAQESTEPAKGDHSE
jgi:signal peptidase II